MRFYFQRTFSYPLLEDSIPNLDFVPKPGTIFFLIHYKFMEVSPSEKFVRGLKKPLNFYKKHGIRYRALYV